MKTTQEVKVEDALSGTLARRGNAWSSNGSKSSSKEWLTSPPHENHSRPMSVDLLGFVHVALLTDFTHREVARFWEDMLTMNGYKEELDEHSLAQIWNDGTRQSPDFIPSVLHDLEVFLASHEVRLANFLRERLLPTIVASRDFSRAIMTHSVPDLPAALTCSDFRQYAMAHLHETIMKVLPVSDCGMLMKKKEHLCFTYEGWYLFGASFSSISLNIWIGELIALIPSMFGCPDFDDVRIELKGYSGQANPTYHIQHDGMEGLLSASARDQNCFDEKSPVSSTMLNEHTPCLTRPGGLIALSRIEFKKSITSRNPLLLHMQRLLNEEPCCACMDRAKNKVDLKTPYNKYRFEYRRASESLLLNNARIVTKGPAAVLAVLLQTFVTTGRREFDMRAIWSHPWTVHDYTGGQRIYIWLSRLVDMLKRKAPNIVLERLKGEGRILFTPSCEIEFSVVDG